MIMFEKFWILRALRVRDKTKKLDIRPALKRDREVETERPVIDLMEGMVEKPGGKQ